MNQAILRNRLRKAAGFLAAQTGFLLLRWVFAASGGKREGMDLFSQWRFTAGIRIDALSFLNVLHLFVLSVRARNALHRKLGADRIELLIRRGIQKSALRESLIAICGIALSEVFMTGEAILIGRLFHAEQIAPQWEVYLPMQLSFWWTEVTGVLIMDILLCGFSGEASNVIMVFVLLLMMGAAYVKIRWVPLFASSYDLLVQAGWVQQGTIPAECWALLLETCLLWLLWMCIRRRNDIL